MQYRRISADCHLDLPWLPRDLFTSQASRALKDRMPFVEDGPDGPLWKTKAGVAMGGWGGGDLGDLIAELRAMHKGIVGAVNRSAPVTAWGVNQSLNSMSARVAGRFT